MSLFSFSRPTLPRDSSHLLPGPRWIVPIAALAVLGLLLVATLLSLRSASLTEWGRGIPSQPRLVLDLLEELRLNLLRTTFDAAYQVDGASLDPQAIRAQAGGLLDTAARLRRLVEDEADPAKLRQLDDIEAGLGPYQQALSGFLDDAGQAGGAEVRSLVEAELPLRRALDSFAHREAERYAASAGDAGAASWQTVGLIAAAGLFLLLWSATLLVLVKRGRRLSRQVVDLTEANRQIRRQNEVAQVSERRLHAVLENGQDSILLVSTDGDVILANHACARDLGLPQDQLAGLKVFPFLPGLELQDGASWTNEARRHDGSKFPAEVTIGACQLDRGAAFVCIMRDITERQRLERIKDDFVSTVSHELRTPLTSIRGSLGLIVSNAAGELPPKAKALLDIAHKNSIRLIELVNDLLDIEKIETRHIEMQLERTDVSRLVAATVEANQGFARQFSVDLTVEDRLDPDCRVMAHPGRLQQVLANLISNAIKFSPAGRPVQVALHSTEREVTVAVRDFGPGIPDDFRPQMFRRFAQADSGDARRSSGTGLGLSIVKAIVERHHGTIDFESPLPDGGTRFWFTLPRLIEEPPVEAAPPVVVDHRPAVLICEDDYVTARLLQTAISRGGWRATIVASAEAALEALRAQRFAAMTVDLGLPAMSGLELIKAVDADPRHRTMPIIVISCTAEDEDPGLGVERARVVNWMKKPTDEIDLRRTLTDAVNRFSSLRILHVEDDADLIVILSEIIGDTAEIEVASTIATAREMLEQRRFDLVVLDVRLPDGNGLDLVPLLRTTNHQAALLILSAEDVSAGGHAMIQATLTKARMDNAQLANTISQLLAEARRRMPTEKEHGGRAADQDSVRR